MDPPRRVYLRPSRIRGPGAWTVVLLPHDAVVAFVEETYRKTGRRGRERRESVVSGEA